jgi:hypothetical protein
MAEGILKKRIGIENAVDEFMDRVSEAGLLCKNGMDAYLKGRLEAFAASLAANRINDPSITRMSTKWPSENSGERTSPTAGSWKRP